MPLDVTIYSRYSPRPFGETSESIELQTETCMQMIHSRPNAYKFAKAFEDRELSGGRADNRPGLQAALDETCKRKGILMCYSVSRLARNTRDCLEIADRLARCDAHLCLLDMNVDTSTPMGRCFLTLMSAFAELERRQTGQRTSDAMKRMQNNGRVMSRYAPFGWNIDPVSKMLKPNKQEQIALSVIDAAEGNGVLAATRLNKMGLFTRAGGKWYPCDVERIGERSLKMFRAQKEGSLQV